MDVQPPPPSDEMQPQIKIGRVESINLYQVKENELETLEKRLASKLGFYLRYLSILNCHYVYSRFVQRRMTLNRKPSWNQYFFLSA